MGGSSGNQRITLLSPQSKSYLEWYCKGWIGSSFDTLFLVFVCVLVYCWKVVLRWHVLSSQYKWSDASTPVVIYSFALYSAVFFRSLLLFGWTLMFKWSKYCYSKCCRLATSYFKEFGVQFLVLPEWSIGSQSFQNRELQPHSLKIAEQNLAQKHAEINVLINYWGRAKSNFWDKIECASNSASSKLTIMWNTSNTLRAVNRCLHFSKAMLMS